MNPNIKITNFHPKHQPEIDRMMQQIATEFEEPIFLPSSTKIVDIAELSNNQFWVALSDDKVIGTIGLTTLDKQSIVLRSMFLLNGFRGFGVGKLLLETVVNWCLDNDVIHIYLGTMTQFKSGQRFYERNGFEQVLIVDLPNNFPINPVDTLFYYRKS